MHYKNILLVLKDIHETNEFIHEKTRVFEDETYALFQFFDNIQENPGLPDWFKYFCEGQCEIVTGLTHYYYKYETQKIIEILSDGYLELLQNERERLFSASSDGSNRDGLAIFHTLTNLIRSRKPKEQLICIVIYI